ncbi:hypothetical protein MBLNU230_g1036t2 [Neophaeotheca triangularis]
MSQLPRKLWEHPNPQSTAAFRFMQTVNRTHNLNLQSWDALYDWSVTDIPAFWEQVFHQHPIIHSGSYSRVYDTAARMDSVPRWFEGVRVNFAENVLFTADPTDASRGTTTGKEDGKIACTEVREGCTEVRDVSWKELRQRVGALANAMRANGVGKGDRVAVVASNSLDTLVVFYAVTAVGGLFSSSSTDMGTKGVLDRLTQIKPDFVFVDDWAVYNGKSIDLRPKMREIVEGMKGIGEFKGLVSMPRWQDKPEDISGVPRTQLLSSFLSAAKGDSTLRFEKIAFDDPFIVVYSSGTTGIPKCIVHSTGGVLINSKKEGILHRDVGPSSTVLQYTTTGWIMYLTSCQVMQHGARAVLYDGSPFQPDLTTFLKLVGDQKVTDLGISPRYLQTLASAKPPIFPKNVTDLSSLKRVSSTGMVLSEAQFHWFYDQGFPPHVQLANISGGTDLAACFACDTPLKPLYVGGCQTLGLGLKVQVFDQTIEGGAGQAGREVSTPGEPGELVCTRPFPTMPIKFWGADGAEKYFNAYFARFDDVWTHGDFIQVDARTKQIYFLGRADGVLNPSGVRFGSAEIYNVVDQHFAAEVQDSICVGQRRPQDEDERVLLFLMMKPGKTFSRQLVRGVKEAIATHAGRRCVPKFVFETPEIPTTINLKKVELPVKQIVSGKTVKPSDTLANKDCLDFYYQFAKDEVLAQAEAPASKL